MPDSSIADVRTLDAADRRHVRNLYDQHHGWLSGWLGRKLDCSQDAADLSHDTFLKLLTSREVGVLKEPRAYLLVIANRLLINRYRRKKVEREVLQQVAVLLEDREKRGPAEIILNQDLLARVVMLLLEELPEKPRRAYLMSRVDGLSYREIADKLQVSQSSVKQYLAKVLAHLHARLYSINGGAE